eukprot:gene18139-23658_t
MRSGKAPIMTMTQSSSGGGGGGGTACFRPGKAVLYTETVKNRRHRHQAFHLYAPRSFLLPLTLGILSLDAPNQVLSEDDVEYAYEYDDDGASCATESEGPTLKCPPDVTVNTMPSQCFGIVKYDLPVATDNCELAADMEVKYKSGLRANAGAAPSKDPVPTRYTVLDGALLEGECTFKVQVVDNEPPTIACPDDIHVDAPDGSCKATVTYDAVVGKDNCPHATTTRIAGGGSGGELDVGSHSITHSVTDFFQEAACTFKIVVADAQPPTVTCPSSFAVKANGAGEYTLDFEDAARDDNCGQAGVTISYSPPKGTTLDVGEATVTATASDAAGNDKTSTTSQSSSATKSLTSSPTSSATTSASATAASTVTTTMSTTVSSTPTLSATTSASSTGTSTASSSATTSQTFTATSSATSTVTTSASTTVSTTATSTQVVGQLACHPQTASVAVLVAGGATCLEQAEILSRIASDCGADASSVKCASSELSSGTPLFAGDSCSKAAEAVNRLVGEYVSVAHGDASRATAVCNLAGYIKVKGACAPFADILNDAVRDVQNGVLNNKCDITTQTTTATTSETTSASTTVTSTAYKEGIECTEVAGSALLIGGSGSTCVRVSKDLSAMASECGHGDVVIKCKDTAVGPVLLDAEACAETMKALNTLLDGYSTGQTIGTLTCELGGYLKDDVDCPSTVAVLTDALAAYHGGIFTNC